MVVVIVGNAEAIASDIESGSLSLCSAPSRTRAYVLSKLRNRLWHTTSLDRFKRILADGFLSPEPNIPEHERWKTSRGPEYYPFARTLGAVSLFDFDDFDPDEYDRNYPMSSWAEFVPFRSIWGHSVWIEIDRCSVEAGLISGSGLLKLWKEEAAFRHTVMPQLEAAHLGELPSTGFRRAYLAKREVPIWQELRVAQSP